MRQPWARSNIDFTLQGRYSARGLNPKRTFVKKRPSSARSGLLAAGNWIIDQVKMVDVYPQRDQLANIRGQSQGTGGSPYNVLIDLARLEAPFPLRAAGLVGRDDLGRVILEDCRRHHID